ncbi:helix-turn-helix domain-containing protein [Reyranella soli]
MLGYLPIHADRFGVAWPSQEKIATVLGVNRATVCRGIKRLRSYQRRTR